jgi:nitroimidazol reductase NimA-like FMN-containing flavoprotein (pyridoxamine 5'-phosphate oxidase superfamily)
MTTEQRSGGAIERLVASECWRLLQEETFGRLAVTNVDGAPDVFPVNYVTHEGSLFFRTARDAKLAHIAQHPAVAFEIDGDTDDVRWSVVVRGTAERVTREDEIRDSGVKQLASWSPVAKYFVVKITAHTVTGRGFPKDAGRADRSMPFGGGATATAPEQPAAGRASAPQEIPHHGPRTDDKRTTDE